MRTETLATLARPLGSVGLPGFFKLVVDPVHRRCSPAPQPVIERIHGSEMELDLTEYVQRRIYYGTYESPEARLVKKVLVPGDLVVDVGANIGFFTLLAARTVGDQGRVLAIEPVPANAEALSRNVERNELANVEIVNAAVAATPGVLQLGLSGSIDGTGAHGTAGTSGCFTVGGDNLVVDVPAVTLDSLLLDLEGPVRLIKIDVEGYEPQALAGLAQTLAQRPPELMLIEVNPGALARTGGSAKALRNLLVDSGYRLHRVTLTGRPRPLRRSHGWSPGGATNLLAVHEAR